MTTGKPKDSTAGKDQFNPFAPITKLHHNMLNTQNSLDNIENQNMADSTDVSDAQDGLDKFSFYPEANMAGE